MPETQTFQELVYAGDFSTGQLAAAGVALLLIIALLFWRESSRTSRWIMLLTALRVLAVLTVLWMLAGPTIITTTRHSRPRSIGILVDTSASMGVVDPATEAAAAVRWAAAQRAGPAASVLVDTDGAAAVLTAARDRAVRLSQACRSSGKVSGAQALAGQMQKLLQTATGHLERAWERLRGQDGAGEFGRVLTKLKDTAQPRVESLVADLQAGRLLLDRDGPRRLQELAGLLHGLAQRLTHAADELAGKFAGPANTSMARSVRDSAAQSRVEKVAACLRRAQESWLEAQQTDLAAAMEQISRDAAFELVEAVVLFSDGRHNADRDPRKMVVAASGLPLLVVPVGNTQPLRDVILHHANAPRAVFKNDKIIIDATVDAYGYKGQELEVELIRRDHDKVIDRRKFEVVSDSFTRKVTFNHKADQMGKEKLVIRVRALPGERVAENNSAFISVDVIEDEISVLLIDQIPRWEYRYLRRLLERAKYVKFTRLLLEPRQGGRPAEGTGLPTDLDAWSRHRVVILGDVGPSVLTEAYQEMLAQYVARRGGTLVIIAGRLAMPAAYRGMKLERLLPVNAVGRHVDDSAGFGLFLTADGRSLPSLQIDDDALVSEQRWREISRRLPVYSLSRYSVAKPIARVLIGALPRRAEAESHANPKRCFLCWQYYGKGRVVYLAAPITYQLRLRRGDRHHQRFWAQLLRWAVAREMSGGSRTVRLTTDKTRYERTDTVLATVQLSELRGGAVTGAAPRVVAYHHEDIVTSVALAEDEEIAGLYRGELKKLPPGSIVLEVAGAQIQSLLAAEGFGKPVRAIITVDPHRSMELRNTRCNLPMLNQLAQSSGGMVVPPTALGPVLSQLDLSPRVSEKVAKRPLWNRWAALWVFLGCLAVEWVVRKLVGLA